MEAAANALLAGSGTELQSVRTLLRRAEMSLNALCDAISGSNVLDSCESDSAALAAACREYRELTGNRAPLDDDQSARSESGQRGAQY